MYLTDVRLIYTEPYPRKTRKRAYYTAKQRQEYVDRFLRENQLTGISAKHFEDKNGLTNATICQWKKKLYGELKRLKNERL